MTTSGSKKGMQATSAKMRMSRARTCTVLSVGVCVALLLPGAIAHEGYAFNRVVNGGFESGFAGWTGACFKEPSCPGLSIATNDTCLDSQALVVTNRFAGGMATQPLPSTPGYSLLDASAKVLANPANPGSNSLQVSGGTSMIARLTLSSDMVALRVFDNFASPVTFDLTNNSGVCHHLQVVLSGVSRTGMLFVDGTFVGTATGLATSSVAPSSIIVGDFAGYDSNPGAGPAPDVMWDGIYFGP